MKSSLHKKRFVNITLNNQRNKAVLSFLALSIGIKYLKEHKK